MNRVTMIGLILAEPEIRVTETRVTVLTIHLETTKKWTDQSGAARSRTERHLVNYFGGRAAEFARMLHKGGMAWIEGELQYRPREDSSSVAMVSANFITPWGAPG